MLRIVTATEAIEVKTVNLCFYSGPGLGKTSLAQTSTKPLTLDADHGIYRAGIRRDCVVVNTWADVASLSAEDLTPYSTIVVDTVGRMLDVMTTDIIRLNPKMGVNGALTLQGFGQLKGRFHTWMTLLNSFGKDVVLLAHMEEQKAGDNMLERLDVQGGSKGEIFKVSDGMARIVLDAHGKRMLDFSPRPYSYGKNPCQFDLIPFPDPKTNDHTLADIIEGIKYKLNQLAHQQKDFVQEQNQQASWQEALKTVSSLEVFNSYLPALRKAPDAVRALAARKARALGFTYNKNTQVYEVPNAGRL